MTSHTTDSKTRPTKTLDPPRPSAHADAVIPSQPGGQHLGVRAGVVLPGRVGAAYCQSSLSARPVDGCRSGLSAKHPVEPRPARGAAEPPSAGPRDLTRRIAGVFGAVLVWLVRLDWQWCRVGGRFLGVQAEAASPGRAEAAYCQLRLTARPVDGCRSWPSASVRLSRAQPAPSTSPTDQRGLRDPDAGRRRAVCRGVGSGAGLVGQTRLAELPCRSGDPRSSGGDASPGRAGAAYCPSSLTARSWTAAYQAYRSVRQSCGLRGSGCASYPQVAPQE
jgi:hypothetical protein